MTEYKSIHVNIYAKQHELIDKLSYLTKKSIAAITRDALQKVIEENKKILSQKIG